VKKGKYSDYITYTDDSERGYLGFPARDNDDDQRWEIQQETKGA
jgi:hypothetical protein